MFISAVYSFKTDDVAAAEVTMYQPQYQQQSGTAVVYTTQQPVALTVVSPVCESYKSRQSMIAGIILILAGVLSIVFNAVGIPLFEVFSAIGQGFWCGILVSKTLPIKCYLTMAKTALNCFF